MSIFQESPANGYSISIIMVGVCAGVFISYMALLSLGARAQVIPPPIFTTTSPVKNRVVMENIYNFTERTYIPPVTLNSVANRGESIHDLPENAVISHISAAINLDYKWWLGTWDPKSQELIHQFENGNRPERPEAYWRKRWEIGYKNKRIFFISRIETGDYVIIGLQIMDKEKLRTGEIKPNANGPQLPVVLKQFGDRWLATQELQSDPILFYWSTVKKQTVFQNVVRQ